MIPLASKYQVFCQAVSRKSFTEAAKVLHYSQSAVSQAVKAVEQEVGLTLVLRKKDGIELTSDGKKVYPYIQNICDAEMRLRTRPLRWSSCRAASCASARFRP